MTFSTIVCQRVSSNSDIIEPVVFLKLSMNKIKIFIDNLKNHSEVIYEFDERLWYTLVQKVIVNTDKEIEVKFKN